MKPVITKPIILYNVIHYSHMWVPNNNMGILGVFAGASPGKIWVWISGGFALILGVILCIFRLLQQERIHWGGV